MLIRVAIVAFWFAVIAFSIYVFLSDPIGNDIYGFFIHDESAFHCPSCGLTRAAYCLMRLDFAGALYYHAYFTVISPVLAYFIICLTGKFVGREENRALSEKLSGDFMGNVFFVDDFHRYTQFYRLFLLRVDDNSGLIFLNRNYCR